MAFIVESRRGKHRFATFEAACAFCSQVFEKTGVVLSVVQRYGTASPEHFRMLSEFRQGQADRKAGRPCSSTNGRYLEGWYDPERHLPDFLTQKMLEEIENGPE